MINIVHAAIFIRLSKFHVLHITRNFNKVLVV